MCNLDIKPFYKSFKNSNVFLANKDMPFPFLLFPELTSVALSLAPIFVMTAGI